MAVLWVVTGKQFSLSQHRVLRKQTGSNNTQLNGQKSAQKPHRKEVSRFLFKSFYIRRLQEQLFFSHTNPYILTRENDLNDGRGSCMGDSLSYIILS